jgi:hypothetical protein
MYENTQLLQNNQAPVLGVRVSSGHERAIKFAGTPHAALKYIDTVEWEGEGGL